MTTYTPDHATVQELYTTVMTSRPIDADATRATIAEILNTVAKGSSNAMLERIVAAASDASLTMTIPIATTAPAAMPAKPAVRERVEVSGDDVILLV